MKKRTTQRLKRQFFVSFWQSIQNFINMSAYIYAIIPYKSGISFSSDDPIRCVWEPILPELEGIDSEFTEKGSLSLFADFFLINTCYRQSAFTDNIDGYSWIRADICQIAKALGAHEVWYVEELITDEMDMPDFSFDEWINSLKHEKKQYVVELTTDVLKGNSIYSYYHDGFSDIIMEKPLRNRD